MSDTITYRGIQIPWWEILRFYDWACNKRRSLLRANNITLQTWHNRMRSNWDPVKAATVPDRQSIWTYTIGHEEKGILQQDVASQNEISKYLYEQTGKKVHQRTISAHFSKGNIIRFGDYWVERKCNKR